MKKILSFVLVLAMILGSVSMAFAGSYKDVADEADYAEAVEVLTAMGIVEGNGSGIYRPADTLTRAEAVAFIVKALNLPVVEGKSYDCSKWTDVANDAWYAGYVYYATALGITEGTSANTFTPDAKVTYDQMLAFTLRAIGYAGDDKIKGGYPAGYTLIAANLEDYAGTKIDFDLIKTGTEAATRGDIANMVYALTYVGFVDYNKNTDSFEDTFNNLTNTFAGRKGCTLSTTADVLTPGAVAAAKADLSASVGAYGRTITKNGDVIGFVADSSFAKANSAKTQIGGLALSKLTTAGAVVIINNEVTGAAFAVDTASQYALLTSGTATIVESQVKWVATEDYQIAAADVKALADKNPTLGAGSFALPVDADSQLADTTKFVLEGVDALADIAKNDIVTIYANSNGVAKLVVSKTTLEGNITKIDESTSTKKYTIGGKTYTETSTTHSAPTLAINSETGTFYLNAEGKIVAYAGPAAEKIYGIYLRPLAANGGAVETVTSDSSSASKTGVALLTAEGKEIKVYIDGTNVTTNAGVTGQIYEYTLNTKGELSTMNAITEATAGAVSAKGVLGSKQLTANTLVFKVTTTSSIGVTQAAAYSIVDASSLYGKNIIAANVLTKASSDVYVMAVVNVAAATGTTTDDVYAVTKLVKTSSDGAYEITVLNLSKGTTAVLTTTKDYGALGLDDTKVNSAAAFYNFTLSGTAATSASAATISSTTKAISTTPDAIKVSSNGIVSDGKNVSVELADDCLVYQFTKSSKTWEKVSVSTLEGLKDSSSTTYAITAYETNSTEGHEGWDMVIIVK